MTINVTFTRTETASVSDQEIINALKARFFIEDLTIINGVIHRYERVGYSDYDYVEYEPPEAQMNALLVLDNLVKITNATLCENKHVHL